MKSPLGTMIVIEGALVLAQSYGISVYGIIPDLALIGIVLASLVLSRIEEGILIVVLAAALLKFGPAPAGELIAFTMIGVAILFMRRTMPYHASIHVIASIVLGTTLMYALLTPHLIKEAIMVREIVVNCIIGAILFVITEYLWQNKRNNAIAELS